MLAGCKQDKERMTMCFICDAERAEKQAISVTEFWDPETQPLTVAKLADAVRQASIKEPNKIYQRTDTGTCLYTHDSGLDDGSMIPGCIVGQGVFDLTGKVVNQRALGGGVNNARWTGALGALTGEKTLWGDVILVDDPLTKYLVSWLRNVQSQQDGGDTWGDAVAYADRHTYFGDFAS